MARIDPTDKTLSGTNWILEALEVYRRTPRIKSRNEAVNISATEFKQRCREASLSALAIQQRLALEKMHAERERVGFAPVSIGKYLRELAQAIGVQIEMVLNSFQIDDLDCPNVEQAHKIARLSRALGMTCQEASAAILIAFTQQRSITPDAIFARGRADTTVHPLEACVAALEHLKTEAAPEVRNEMTAIENAVRAEFKTDEHIGV